MRPLIWFTEISDLWHYLALLCDVHWFAIRFFTISTGQFSQIEWKTKTKCDHKQCSRKPQLCVSNSQLFGYHLAIDRAKFIIWMKEEKKNQQQKLSRPNSLNTLTHIMIYYYYYISVLPLSDLYHCDVIY